MKLVRCSLYAFCLLLFSTAAVQAQSLTLLQGVSGDIESGQQEQRWFFDGEAGQEVIFHAAGLLESQQIMAERVDNPDATTGSELQPTVQVYAPSGALLEEVDAGEDLHARTNAISLPATGRYTIVVKAQNDTYGQYVLAAAPANIELNQKQAALNQSWVGITGSRSGESWSFEGTEGQNIEVEFYKNYSYSNNNFYSYSRLALISPDGDVLVRNTQERIDPLELPSTGTYTIQIADSEEQNLLYSITVSENDKQSVDSPMIYFETLYGSFRADEVNEWPYQAAAGETGILTIQQNDGSEVLYVSVVAPDGSEVASADTRDGYYYLNMSWTAEQDGEYTILINGQEGQPASYYITLTRDDVIEPRSLNFGEPVTDVLRRPEDSHVWTFEGETGQDVLVKMEGIYDFTLLMPDGQDYSGVSGNYQLDNQHIRLPQAGTWEIHVNNNFSTMPYTAYTIRVDLPPAIASDSKLVEVGQIVTGTANFDAPDEIQVDLPRSGSYSLVIRQTSAPPSINYYSYFTPQIVDPNGNTVYSYSSGDNPPRAPYVQQFNVDVTESGIHTIRIKPDYEGEQFGYMLAVLPASSADKHALWVDGDIATDVTMAIGESVVLQGLREEYDENPTPNIVTFEGNFGQNVRVRLNFLDYDRENVIKIFDPDGNFMAESYSEGYSALNELIANLPVSGEYHLEITTFVAPYQVTLMDAELDPHRGVMIDGMGYPRRPDEFGSNTQLDEWTFFGRVGQVVAIRMYEDTSYDEYDPFIELFSPSDEFLAESDDFDDLNAFIPSVTLPEDGLYRIVAQDYSGQFGDYHLVVIENGDQEINVYRTEAERIDACTTLTRSAYSAITAACANTRSNQACLLSGPINIEDANGAQMLSSVGANMSLADVRVLQSTPLDEAASGYGMTYMRLPTQTVGGGAVGLKVIAIGDVSILNPAIQNIVLDDEPPIEATESSDATPIPQVALDLVVTGGSSINVRGGPTTNAGVVASGQSGVTYRVVGRNADSTWFYVELPEGGTGWMFSDLVSVTGDTSSLPVTEAAVVAPASSAQSGGSQGGAVSFYMTSNANDSQCKRGPESGLMLYAPVGYENLAQVTINGVNIRFQGTLFIQAEAGASMNIYSVDGGGEVRAMNQTEYLYSNSRTTVLLDGDLNPASAPGDPENYDYRIVRALPLSYVR
jgi:uncharacterized protein YraI